MPEASATKQSRILLAARDIKLAHSVFALPFAILGAALSADFGAPPRRLLIQFALIIICMVFARTWAMLVNRLADYRLDAHNPRTAQRAIASGKLSPRDAMIFTALAGIAFCTAAFLFWPLLGNPWPTYLCVPVLGFIALYSFTKRFTALCHLFLGAALALSPVAAVIAIDPTYLREPTIWLIAGFVLLWVAGFDVIYALQDLDYDRGAGLHSIPAALGWSRAIWLSRAMHALAFASITLAWLSEPRLAAIFLFLGLAPLAGLLTLEHTILAQRGKAGIPMAFFTLNGLASLLLGTAGVLDLIF